MADILFQARRGNCSLCDGTAHYGVVLLVGEGKSPQMAAHQVQPEAKAGNMTERGNQMSIFKSVEFIVFHYDSNV